MNAAFRSAAEFGDRGFRDDYDVDAERLFTLAQYYRSVSPESQMAPPSRASRVRRQAAGPNPRLFLAGNYYWVQLDRDRASGYYKRLVG